MLLRVWEGPELGLELVLGLGLVVLVEVLARIGAGARDVVWLLVVGMAGSAVLDSVEAVAAIHEDDTVAVQSYVVELDSSPHQVVIARLEFQDYWDSPGVNRTFVVVAVPLAVAGGEAEENCIVPLEVSAVAAAAAQPAFVLAWEEAVVVLGLLDWERTCSGLQMDRIPVVMEAQVVVWAYVIAEAAVVSAAACI